GETAAARRAGERRPRGGSFAGWAAAVSPTGCGLRWWESAAAAGSSLGIYVLIATAAEPASRGEELTAIARAYFPWVGALHSMLDSVVDVAEDAAGGQHSLFADYAAPEEARSRMGLLARGAWTEASALPRAERHLVLLAGMCGMYLSAPEARRADVAAVRSEILAEVPLARLAIAVFSARRLFERVARSRRAPAEGGIEDGRRRLAGARGCA
ncbi:MAG: DUF2600 family protein, partial [Solirubrobacteraceae bacterium]